MSKILLHINQNYKHKIIKNLKVYYKCINIYLTWKISCPILSSFKMSNKFLFYYLANALVKN